MAITFDLVRVLNRMQGEIAEAAKKVVHEQEFSSDASRSQFKLAIEGAQQAQDLRLLQAFLAYQSSRDNKVWGHRSNDLLFVQRAWQQFERQIQAYERNAERDARTAWQQASDGDKQALRQRVAERFFAHIERAFEVWSDAQARRFYFGEPQPQEEPSEEPPSAEEKGEDQDGA